MTTATRSEQLVEAIRLDIVFNRLPAGSRLNEEALADRFEVSRTPIREALRALTRESLLVYTPHSGHTVAVVNLADMDDLYSVCVAIEEQAARRITLGEN